MNELPLAGANLPEYSVSELSAALKRSIEENFGFVRVRGEVSGFKRVASGHCYLSLKDAEAVLDAVCWRGTAGRLAVKPEDGMEVVCTGRLTTYPGRSKYQIVIETVELAGVGALLKLLEERRQRLAAEGLFAAERKKKPPFLPALIGIVTSPTGAVIRDILHRLADRFPRPVLLWPVSVQGEAAAAQVAAAIEGFNKLPAPGAVPRPDLIIVARGGGSLEDLMPFNEEIVVRAVAASAIPLISAIGHETDTTLIDYAADLRAPTPTAAAELAVPVRLDLIATVGGAAAHLSAGLSRLLTERRLRLEGMARGLPDPGDLIGGAGQRLDDRAERLRLAGAARLLAARQRLELAAARLGAPGARIDEARREAARVFERLRRSVAHDLALARERFSLLGPRLRPQALSGDLDRARAAAGEADQRLRLAMTNTIERQRTRLDSYAGRLATHSERHRSLLARGYVVVRDARAKVVTEAAAIGAGEALDLEFADGHLGAVAGSKRRRRKHPTPPRQGELI